MESANNLRKSCDFCYMRKIRCDGQKPRCSHCVAYSRDCTYSAPSRKSKPKRRRNYEEIGDEESITQSRLQHLEDIIKQLTERLEGAEKRKGFQAENNSRDPTWISTVPLSTTPTDEGGNPDNNDSSPRSMFLPPIEQILPVVHIFLQEFNTVLPLFHAETLLRLVHDCYDVAPTQRDPVAWAAVNVVLALAHREVLAGAGNTKRSSEYLKRAQSVLSAVALGDTQLLNIQVLVGMVMLSQGAHDLQPSLILIATTMRLAHKIGLHSRASSAHLDPILARQYARVFWMAYILDKDLSMRSTQPSIQRDDDIDLDLPSPEDSKFHLNSNSEGENASIDAGIVTTVDGAMKMNYFISRIQLAVIEGGVYDYLYSTRSKKRSPEERSRALESVAGALEKWKASVPSEFSAVAVLRGVAPGTHRLFCVLHSTSLACTTLINQAHAWNTQWIASLQSYGRGGISPLLPARWEGLVDEARDLMVLCEALQATDRWNLWVSGCSYMTAIMLLTANGMHRPKHEKQSLDNQLVDAGLQALDKMVEQTDNQIMRSFRYTCDALNQDAQRRRDEAAMRANNREFPSNFATSQWST